MVIKEALQSASIPKSVSPNPALDAVLLLAKVIKKSKEFILAHPEYKITANQTKIFHKLIARRQKFEPLAYLLGEQEFYGLNFKVCPNVLIPRPETELIVDEIIATEKKPTTDNRQPTTVIDVGTGSGCIIISLAKKLNDKNIKFFGLDVSAKALAVAKFNAKKLLNSRRSLSRTAIRDGNDASVKFVKSDLLKALMSPTNNFRLTTNDSIAIIANLPYLTSAQIKNSPSIKHEPRLALAGGKNGLALYQKLLEQIAELKKIKPLSSRRQTKTPQSAARDCGETELSSSRRSLPMYPSETAASLGRDKTATVSRVWEDCVETKTSFTIYLEIDPSQTKLISAMIKKILPTGKLEIKQDLSGKNRLVIINL